MQPLEYRAPGQPKRDLAFPCVFASLATGLCGNVIGMLAASTLRQIPPGSSVRPMSLAATLCLIALATAAIGIPLAIVGLVRARRRALLWVAGIIGALLCLAPAPTSRWVWDRIETRNRLTMEP
jgi:hypothetical protein